MNLSTFSTFKSIDECRSIVTTPGIWSTQDSYNFHLLLAQHTEIEGGKLILHHNYFDNRDMQIIEGLESRNKEEIAANIRGGFQRSSIIHILDIDNDMSGEKDCEKMYMLLCSLQHATGNNYTMRQLNNKHVNTKSRLSTPFSLLNNGGYFLRSQVPRSGRPLPVDFAEQIRARNVMSNMDVKNATNIRALHRYFSQKDTFWDDVAECVPDIEGGDMMKGNDESSEAFLWLRAMIVTHGTKMITYLDMCVINLLNSYLVELYNTDRLESHVPVIVRTSSHSDKDMVYSMLLCDLTALSKQKGKKSAGKAASKRARDDEKDLQTDRKSAKVKTNDSDELLNVQFDSNTFNGMAALGEQILQNAVNGGSVPVQSSDSNVNSEMQWGINGLLGKGSGIPNISANNVLDPWMPLVQPVSLPYPNSANSISVSSLGSGFGIGNPCNTNIGLDMQLPPQNQTLGIFDLGYLNDLFNGR